MTEKRKRNNKPGPQIQCVQCATVFQRRSGPNKFCSVRCRNKARWNKPKEKERQRLYQRNWREQNREQYKTYMNAYYPGYAQRKMALRPWAPLLTGAFRRAKTSNLPFDLDEEWAKQRWTNRCELTQIEFAEPSKRIGYKNRNFSPSIDKIDSKKGYTKDNCRIILWAVNAFKRDSSDEDMYRIARALIQHAPKKAATSPTVEQ